MTKIAKNAEAAVACNELDLEVSTNETQYFKARLEINSHCWATKNSNKTKKLQTAINFLVRNIFAEIGALVFNAKVDDVTDDVPKEMLGLTRNNGKANWEFANSRVQAMFEKAVAIELANKTAITTQVEKLNPVGIAKWLRNVDIDDRGVLMNCFAGCFCNKYTDFSEMVKKLTAEIYYLGWGYKEVYPEWAQFAILLDEYKSFDGKLIAAIDKALMDKINPPPVEADVNDYSVTPEAQDVAVQAEVDNANVEIEINPFKPEFYFDWNWQIGIRIRDIKGSVEKLTAIKLEVASYALSVQSEHVYAENALIIRKATSDAGNKFAPSSDLIVYCHNDKGKPMAFIKTAKPKYYTQYCRGGKHDYFTDWVLVFKKYVKADRLKYALALFELTIEQLEKLYANLKIGEQANINESIAPPEIETATESNATKFGLVENDSDDKSIVPITAVEIYSPIVEVQTADEVEAERFEKLQQLNSEIDASIKANSADIETLSNAIDDAEIADEPTDDLSETYFDLIDENKKLRTLKCKIENALTPAETDAPEFETVDVEAVVDTDIVVNFYSCDIRNSKTPDIDIHRRILFATDAEVVPEDFKATAFSLNSTENHDGEISHISELINLALPTTAYIPDLTSLYDVQISDTPLANKSKSNSIQNIVKLKAKAATINNCVSDAPKKHCVLAYTYARHNTTTMTITHLKDNLIISTVPP